jgi:hypothetical protein
MIDLIWRTVQITQFGSLVAPTCVDLYDFKQLSGYYKQKRDANECFSQQYALTFVPAVKPEKHAKTWRDGHIKDGLNQLIFEVKCKISLHIQKVDKKL